MSKRFDDAVIYRLNGRYGVADLNGKTIVRPIYSQIGFDSYKLLKRVIKAGNGRQTHYYNLDGKCFNCDQ